MALTTPFAQNGDKKAIPQTTSDGSVSFDRGFGSFYALPPEEGGLFIDRAQFNQLMFDTTSAVIGNSNNISTIQGNLSTANANITTLQQKTNNLEKSVSNINNTINQVISSDVTPIGVYKNVENKTIGASGDFRTIQEAFTYAQTHQKQTLAQRLILTLLQDFNQELHFSGAWYPHLVINCNGFSLGSKVAIDLSCFSIENLKLSDNIIISNSIFWFSGDNININYQNENYGRGCITALGATFLYIRVLNITLRSIPSGSGIVAQGNSQIALVTHSTITQTTGANCFACFNGGTIMLNPFLNLNGITIPKANQTANTITNNGLIIGNYYSI